MLFRSYKFLLKLTKKQQVTFNHLNKYVYFTFKHLSPILSENPTLSLAQLRNQTSILFEKYSFTPMFTEIIFPQVLTNLQKKSSHFECSYPISFKQFAYDIKTNTVSLPFCQNIKLSHRREMPSKIFKIELYFKKKNWYINFLISKEPPLKIKENLKPLGIDVGLKSFAFLSNGKVIENPRFYDELKEKISEEQRKLSIKQRNSKNWFEQKEKINKLYTKLHNQRIDFLHKLTSYLTSHYDVIGIESINIKELQQKKHLRNSLSDVSWGEFIEMLQYKCEEKGKHLIQVERFYPSSQLCSACGNRKMMPVHIRTYCCTKCGSKIDRDFNASLNIEQRAKHLYLANLHKT
ncbi:RNA-guided endonuclease TnpB family protein [Bacillus mexicanus]|uniref:RNA-guided endonuclease InsQ/TnpB family protein n=1 Tax=Bacillus mexicanus TaxID=2834415 RepID=UPI003D1CC76E